MFLKTIYGEVDSNAWNGIDITYQEVESLDAGRKTLASIIELDHDYSGEWLTSDLEKAREQVKSLAEDSPIKIRSVKAESTESYSVYEYTLVKSRD